MIRTPSLFLCALVLSLAVPAAAVAQPYVAQQYIVTQAPEIVPSPPRTILVDPGNAGVVAQFSPGDSPEYLVAENDWPSGWYVALGVGLVKPHINSGITSGAPVSAALPTAMHLPIAPLDWTALPDVKIGYRFAGGQDELRVRYQGLFSQGRQFFADFDAWGSGVVHSRLDFNMIDVDYVSREFINWAMGPAPARFLDILFGLRTGNIFFDSNGFGNQVIWQGMRNNFVGIGPHVGVDYSRSLFGPRCGVYLLVDAAGLIGSLRQDFVDVRFLDNGSIAGGRLRRSDCIGVGNLQLEPGIRVLPLADPRFRVSIGYTWQRWWYVGDTFDSNADVTIQGIMFRGEFTF
ncbi:MAG: hypothetical protein FJ271_23195 [Planctomycetes bacterium]|nr:hypothetical protein [Planctomycetota bacterium]